jgi:hypothetical protein
MEFANIKMVIGSKPQVEMHLIGFDLEQRIPL